MRLFIEVDATDAGWGDPEARTRWFDLGLETLRKKAEQGKAGDTGAKKVIQWTSKAWKSLARLLALEKYRNLIETNITAVGITLYTDHKPELYENSLSNKGQLSAWRFLDETADLFSIVEDLYRTGGKMLLVDPLYFQDCALQAMDSMVFLCFSTS
jgi:hypothetical protein